MHLLCYAFCAFIALPLYNGFPYLFIEDSGNRYEENNLNWLNLIQNNFSVSLLYLAKSVHAFTIYNTA